MTPMSFDEMKSVQINILQVIHNFCEEHDIRYSMACGTLLGAVRHKGYIPWDDDIDIYVPRKDYERLIEEFPQSLHNIRIASLSRNCQWEFAYAKAYDDRTFLDEFSIVNKPIGINIDIFPIDKAPSKKKEWAIYNKKRLLLQKIYYIKFLKINWERPFYKNIIHIIGKMLLFPIQLRKLAEIINKYAQKYNNTSSTYLFENIQGWFLKKPFSEESIKDVVDMPFEDRVFKGMKGYDDYLKNAYGNYLTLPPIEKRVKHHFFSPYWKN